VTREEATLRCQQLTGREREILQVTAEGLTSRQVARHLRISTRTVDTHLRHLHDKLGTNTKVQAVVVGVLAGAVDL
jgi:DNA-binding CsgD family transcriptional regulator